MTSIGGMARASRRPMTSIVAPEMAQQQQLLGQVMMQGLDGHDDEEEGNKQLVWYQDGERVEGYDAIGIVSALMMNQLLRMYADTDISNETLTSRNLYSEPVIHIIQIVFLLSYSIAFYLQIYCIVMVVLLKYYFTNLRGHGRSKDALEFMTQTRQMRHLGVRFFWCSILLFVIGTGVSCLANKKFPPIYGCVFGILTILISVYLGRAIAKVMHIFVDCLEVQLFKRMQTICTNDEMIENFLTGLDVQDGEDLRKSIVGGRFGREAQERQVKSSISSKNRLSALSTEDLEDIQNELRRKTNAKNRLSALSTEDLEEIQNDMLANTMPEKQPHPPADPRPRSSSDPTGNGRNSVSSVASYRQGKRGSIMALANQRAQKGNKGPSSASRRTSQSSLAESLTGGKMDGRRSSLVLAQMLEAAAANSRNQNTRTPQSSAEASPQRINMVSPLSATRSPRSPQQDDKPNQARSNWDDLKRKVMGMIKPVNVWRSLTRPPVSRGSQRSILSAGDRRLSASSHSSLMSNRSYLSGYATQSSIGRQSRQSSSGSQRGRSSSRRKHKKRGLHRMPSAASSTGSFLPELGGVSRLSAGRLSVGNGSEEVSRILNSPQGMDLIRQMTMQHSSSPKSPKKNHGYKNNRRRRRQSIA